MREVVDRYKLYKFNELSEDAKQFAIQEEREHQAEHNDYWSNYLLDIWTDKLEELGYRKVQISYRGFWSQGDGASFEAKYISIEDYIKAHKLSNKFRFVLNRAEYVEAHVARHSSFYYHEHTVDVYIHISGDLGIKEETKLGQQLAQLEVIMQHEVKELSRAIYKELEEEYEYMLQDDTLAENIIASEYEFLANGQKI